LNLEKYTLLVILNFISHLTINIKPDFYNKYLDLAALKLKFRPGIGLNLVNYWDGGKMYYLAISREGNIVYFVIAFELV
jgi:hypothetical protein